MGAYNPLRKPMLLLPPTLDLLLDALDLAGVGFPVEMDVQVSEGSEWYTMEGVANGTLDSIIGDGDTARILRVNEN